MVLPRSLIEKLRTLDGVRLRKDAPLAPFTTIGTGGNAALLLTVADTTALVTVLGMLHFEAVPWVCLGAGSNFLVADAGYPSVVIKLDDSFQYVDGMPCAPGEVDDEVIVTAGAATLLARLAAAAAEAGLGGLEFACGIPGSVGGGVAMNAGAYGRSLADVVREVQVASASGQSWRALTDFDHGYRYCHLPPDSIVTAVRFAFAAGDSKGILECHRSIIRKRRGVQPQGVRTFGSAFKNPSGEGAGRLLEAAGLKGVRQGGAEVSSVHANFLVNLGDATTAEVLALMSRMREGVQRTSGVVLEPEVRLVGCRFPWDSSAIDPQEPLDVDG